MRRPQLALLVLIVVTSCFRLPGLDPRLTDHDRARQTELATIARNFVDQPSPLRARVDWVDVAETPRSEVHLYAFAVSIVYRLAGERPLYGRLGSIVLAALACLVFYRIAGRYLSPGFTLLAVLLFSLSPVVFRYARAFTPEASILLCYLLTLERFLAYLDAASPAEAAETPARGGASRAWAHLLAAAAAFAILLLMAPAALHLALVLAALAYAQDGPRALLRRELVVFVLVAVLPWLAHALVAGVLDVAPGDGFGVPGVRIRAWPLDAAFWRALVYVDTTWVLGPVGTVLALYGVFAYSQEREWTALGVGWGLALLLYYGLAAREHVVGEPGLAQHIYVAPLVALLATGGLAVVRQWRFGRSLSVLLVGLTLAYQVTLAIIVLSRPHQTLPLTVGRTLARLSAPEDVVVVLSPSRPSLTADAPGVSQPEVFFHAHRRGRNLRPDHQTGDALRRSLGEDARWFVNFPALNATADSSFHAVLAARGERVAGDERFEIWMVAPPGPAH